MNLLAHAWLSGRDEGLMIGNFIGDFIKGDPAHPRHGLTSGELAGVRLHRAIDSFTDAHPDVAAIRDILRPRCHKYAGAAVDIFFDHYLAADFQFFTTDSLLEFVPYFYDVVQTNQHRLPAGATHMADYMIRQNWLTNYQTLEGIDRSLKGLSRRTAFASGLDTAIIDLETHYTAIGDRFAHYWPALVAHIEAVKQRLSV
ncbi:ACP phosphodiesterase [Spirosoma montaniterrae]|uniref:ACP phosphodiesterase n=1 Tax=Spirosoma montaniterrae TaxID=1178516 RepID=A0A1P9WVB5_9BACT|nr:ACP phosphodiesterase [Spirosoma montaniterrae]AQG79270.1 hypothetical protein AWR27_07985 [Spirosoma montaniterrae]